MRALGLIQILFYLSIAVGSSKPILSDRARSMRSTDSGFTTLDLMTKKDLKGVQEKLAAVSSLIKLEQNPQKKATLQLARGKLFLRLALYTSIVSQTPGENKDKAKQYITQAIEDLEKAIEGLSDERKSEAYYLAGLGNREIGLLSKAEQMFTQALVISPNASFVTTVHMFLAERYFEAGDFQSALVNYGKVKNIDNVEKVALAKYKSAWCYVNLQKLSDAELLLVDLLNSDLGSSDGGLIAEASAADLAYLAGHLRTATEMIDLAKNWFKTDKVLRHKFHRDVFQIYINSSQVEKAKELFPKILLEMKGLDQKVGFVISSLEQSSKDVKKQLGELWLRTITTEIKTLDKDAWQSLERKHLPAILREIEGLAKLQTGQIHMSDLFLLKLDFSRDDSERFEVYKAWLEACELAKDRKCIFDILNRVAQSTSSKEQQKYFLLKKIIVLDEIKTISAVNARLYEKALVAFAKEYTSAPEWKPLTEKLIDMLVQQKRFTLAHQWINAIHAQSPDKENYYRLSLSNFLIGKYDEVANMDNKWSDQRVVELQKKAWETKDMQKKLRTRVVAHLENGQFAEVRKLRHFDTKKQMQKWFLIAELDEWTDYDEGARCTNTLAIYISFVPNQPRSCTKVS